MSPAIGPAKNWRSFTTTGEFGSYRPVVAFQNAKSSESVPGSCPASDDARIRARSARINRSFGSARRRQYPAAVDGR
jgi:hypothetical protein